MRNRLPAGRHGGHDRTAATLLRTQGAVERATGIVERELNLVFDQMASEGLVIEARRTGAALFDSTVSSEKGHPCRRN